jgi:hypothetical protein
MPRHSSYVHCQWSVKRLTWPLTTSEIWHISNYNPAHPISTGPLHPITWLFPFCARHLSVPPQSRLLISITITMTLTQLPSLPVRPSSWTTYILTMKATNSYGMLVTMYQLTRCHMLEDSSPHQHCCKSLKFPLTLRCSCQPVPLHKTLLGSFISKN